MFSLRVAVAFIILLMPLTPTRAWTIEGIDTPRQFSDMTARSLALDEMGHPHLTYGQDHLYYAWHDGGGWQFETVDDSRGAGRHAALTLDRDGRPHISYQAVMQSGAELRYAYQDSSGGWRFEVIDGAGATGLFTSIAIASDGVAWVAYQDQCMFLETALKCAHRNISGWHIELVDFGPGAGEYAGLVLNHEGVPAIVYCYNDSVRYASRSNAGWAHETIGYADEFGGYTSLAMDSGGIPHVSYNCDQTHSSWLKYATRAPDGWHIEQADGGYDANMAGRFSSIAVREDGSPCISYQNVRWGQLKYAWRDEAGWHREWVEGEGVGCYTSLALDPGGEPHITHMAISDGSLRYARRTASGWQREIVDWSDDAGKGASLAVDPAGQPGIVYERANALMYAHLVDEAWVLRAPDPRAAEYMSLAYNTQGFPRISYFSMDDRAVNLASGDASGWFLESVDQEVLSSGGHTSLAVNDTGGPCLAYFDHNTDDLKYTTRRGSTWRILTVDSQGTVGMNACMAFDASWSPHICYYDASHDDLKYAHEDQNGWHIEVVHADIGWENSYASRGLDLAIDSTDRLHLCCAFGSDESLKYGTLALSGWEWQVIAPDVVVDAASLAIDPVGRPCVAYHGGSLYQPSALVFAYRGAGGWQSESVPAEWQTGMYASLGIDPLGRAYIAYYDALAGDLMLATSAEWLAPSERPGSQVASQMRVVGVAPNPTRDLLRILVSFPCGLQDAGTGINLDVYDVEGRRVSASRDVLCGPGPHAILWDSRTGSGGRLAPGVYLLRLSSDDHVWSEAHKVVVTR